MNKRAKKITVSAVTAACYTALTLGAFAVNLASGLIQVRFSEALCVLPFFTPDAISGLFIGCLLSNILTGTALPDIILGSLATLIAAVLTYKLCELIRKKNNKEFFAVILAPLPAVIVNALIVGFLMYRVYDWGFSYTVSALYIAAGQAVACYVLGIPLLLALNRYKKQLFGTEINK